MGMWCKNWSRLPIVAILCLAGGCRDQQPAASSGKGQATTSNGIAGSQPVDVEGLRADVAAFCGDCHAMPLPSSFAKDKWPEEVDKGYEFYRTSGRFDLQPPRQSSVVAFFQAQAPERIVFDEPQRASKPLAVRFRRQVLPRPDKSVHAAVAFLLWEPPREGASGRLLISDMNSGGIYALDLPATELQVHKLADLGHPAIIEPADLDADGQSDYLIGDLGKFLPEDHNQGRAVWLRSSGNENWSANVLSDGLGRVAQVAGGDLDGDGDKDLLVAEFGWRKTGRILLLRQVSSEQSRASYDQEVVDPRHGTSHVRLLDWEGDGDLDFVALISQEHERIELFRNDGTGRFQPETIFAASDPAFGLSGMELIDFDGDGDHDLLITNGDSMDSDTLKPSHGVSWLENKGELPFTRRPLAALPGAYKASAGDLDRDGDLDVVAMAFPPLGSPPETWTTMDLLVILEQTAPGEFVQHTLPQPVGGAALTLGDFDGDGDLDLAAGTFHRGQDDSWITVWWNEGTQ